MLIVLGVNVFPSAIRDVVSELHPQTTGAMQVVLREPGPRVAPPLRVEVERADGVADEAALKARLEELVRGRLTVPVDVRLVPAGSIPRSQMKTALVRLDAPEEEER
jgi:phenylacetate-CoA ligase